jgi:hypothetical protein
MVPFTFPLLGIDAGDEVIISGVACENDKNEQNTNVNETMMILITLIIFNFGCLLF